MQAYTGNGFRTYGTGCPSIAGSPPAIDMFVSIALWFMGFIVMFICVIGRPAIEAGWGSAQYEDGGGHAVTLASANSHTRTLDTTGQKRRLESKECAPGESCVWCRTVFMSTADCDSMLAVCCAM